MSLSDRPCPKPGYVGPLTPRQHILHLLLPVFTGGVWLPVWLVRAIQGSRRPRAPPPTGHNVGR
jgi:hypothetical protein